MTYRTVIVPLSEKEWHTLRNIAQSEYRNPKQQAKVLLRDALGLLPVQVQVTPSNDNNSKPIQNQSTP